VIKLLRFLASYVLDIVVEEKNSSITKQLKLILRNGKLIVNSEFANYSFGNLHKVFQIVFKKIAIEKKQIKSVLILGYGAGSVAKILLDELKLQTSIVGVELDPKIIEVAKQYFAETTKRVDLKNESAEAFVANCTTTYDLVVIDVFVDLNTPQNLQELSFIKSLAAITNKNGTVVYNFIIHSKQSKKQFDILKSYCELHFNNTKVISALNYNKVLILGN
jgi:spermidine synthase